MRTASRKVAPSDSAISFMLRKPCRMRASSPATSVLVLGSMPRMPATNTKSPARVPRFHVPVVLMPPSGESVFTPPGEVDCAITAPAPSASDRATTPRILCMSPSHALSQSRDATSAPRHAGLQRERVQDAAHLALEGRIDELVLLHARFAAKALGNHRCGVMVAVAREVADRHLGVRNARLDQALDLAGVHRHDVLLTRQRPPYRRAANLRSAP